MLPGKDEPNTKLNYDYRFSNRVFQETLQAGKVNQQETGILCDVIKDPHASYMQAPCEKVVKGHNNNYIVLGRDRVGAISEGFGGQGHTQAGMIDIVVGRGGPKASEAYDEDDNPYFINPIFKEEIGESPEENMEDAARIYISQKVNLDDAFGLQSSRGANNIPTRSGIGMKADLVRMVGREGIRLVTGTSSKNSQGGDISSIAGIDLIAGNKAKLAQPLVKGYSLISFMEELLDHVDELSGVLSSYIMAQLEFNAAVASHGHVVPIGSAAIPVPPSIPLGSSGGKIAVHIASKTMPDLINFNLNSQMHKMNYLKASGEKYINSRYNNTN